MIGDIERRLLTSSVSARSGNEGRGADADLTELRPRSMPLCAGTSAGGYLELLLESRVDDDSSPSRAINTPHSGGIYKHTHKHHNNDNISTPSRKSTNQHCYQGLYILSFLSFFPPIPLFRWNVCRPLLPSLKQARLTWTSTHFTEWSQFTLEHLCSEIWPKIKQN